MSFLLDTNICSAYLKRPGPLTHRFVQHGGRLYLPTVVLGELFTWADSRPDPALLLKAIDDLLEDVAVLDFDLSCAREFGRTRSALLGQGIAINPIDLQIAATALVNDFTVVTQNVKHFKPVPNLRVVDWTVP